MKFTLLITCPRCGFMINGRRWRCPGCGGKDIDTRPEPDGEACPTDRNGDTATEARR